MKRLAEPALRAGREGVVLTAFQAFLLHVVGPIYTWTQSAKILFAAGGELVGEGDLFRNPELAEALEAISREGLRIATEGDIARAMSGQIEQHGGHLGADDLARYSVELREPLQTRVGSQEVFLNPPPSLGGALITAMLNEAPGTEPAAIGRAIDRIDQRWREAPTDPARLLGNVGGPSPGTVAQRGTTHISVIDKDGNVAATTVSNGEGNGHVVPGCGFMINNMLGEEDVNPGGFHEWEPGKRLGSMMAPTLAIGRDGALTALGSGGSNRIRTAILQVLLHHCGKGMPLDEAIPMPRVHVERGHLDFEDLFGEGDREAILEAFPEAQPWPEHSLYFGGVHAVSRDAHCGFAGAGDPRRSGVCIIV